MRRPGTAGGLLFVLACAAAAGCFWTGKTRTSLLDRGREFARADAGLLLNTRLIEQPLGDPYVNGGLWDSTARPLGHEQSALLARNGLRVGVLSGVLPDSFDRLVHSEATTISPTLRTVVPGQPKVVPVNGPLERCSYLAVGELAADPELVEVTAAECGLAVTAVPADGGRVKLTCAFQVQHGDKRAWVAETADGTEFTRRDRKPLAEYPRLTFEVTVEPDDYLLIGPTPDAADTLGQAYFVTAGDLPRQRVLVIRAGTK
jgi:hypothetical protein